MRKEKKAVQATSNMVIADSSKRRKINVRVNKKWLIVVLILLVVVAAGLFGYHMWNQARVAEANRAAAKAALPGDTILDKINAAGASGKYDQALAVLDSEDDQQSQEVMSLKAAVYMNKKDYAAALDMYAQLEAKHGLRATEADSAGNAAAALKDYPKAAEYYQLAAKRALADPDNVIAKSDAARYEASAEKMKAMK